jgi:antitoxin component YwqK of YwqJK toxin-antitoxin module
LPATKNGNVTTWTMNSGTFTWTFTGTKQSDGSYTWTWVVNGTYENVTYDHWTYWSGTTSADGKSGSWSFYEYGTTHSVEDLNYTTVNGVLTGTWLIYASGVIAEKFVIINNADNSGEFDMYNDGTTLYEKVTWTASGTGTWATYNPAANGTF